MRVVVQRVSEASVTIEGKVNGAIKTGFLILLGIETKDTTDDIDWLVRKITGLRVFSDEQGLMNKSILDVNGEILLISQFTLHASTKKGNRPSFINAARPDVAIPLYEKFVENLSIAVKNRVKTGIFGADMQVSLVNNGPVTIIIDSKNRE
ncbi:D-aminoacyl-tRNA deacylase [Leeuwenhoekiella sp. A16]|uniref:D-aminoacyl-tRNA deacylase n=1 Tax=unclassified Leeuwenhoekiella TaxID=2615029 RepID=UPI003A80682A